MELVFGIAEEKGSDWTGDIDEKESRLRRSSSEGMKSELGLRLGVGLGLELRLGSGLGSGQGDEYSERVAMERVSRKQR